MKAYPKHILALLALVTIALMSSCRSHKISVTDLNGPTPEQARFESVVQNTYKYDALMSKVKMSLGKSSLNGKLCLESGKRLCLQVNAPLIGFEIARVEASQESVLIVDKYDKMYSVLNLSELYQLDELSGHEMEALECIMLGRIYIPGRGVATAKDYQQLQWTTPMLPDGTKGDSEGLYAGKDYSLIYSINSSGQLVSTQLLIGGKSARWDYSHYVEVEKGKWVPTLENITAVNDGNESLNAALEMTNPQFDESNWRDFEANASYRQVSIDKLVETVKQLAK